MIDTFQNNGATVLTVNDWEIDVLADGVPVVTMEGVDGPKIALRFAREQLPELAASLLRLADHLRHAPPCGTVRPE